MKNKIYIFFIMMGISLPSQASVSLQIVTQPDYVVYNRVFAKFNKYIHLVDGVDIAQIYPFEIMMFALWYNSSPSTRFFLEIDSGSNIVGFALCQMLSATHLIVRQFVIDPEIFDGAMLAPLLGQCLGFVPGVTDVSVLCPATFSATIATLEMIGFTLNGSADFPVAGIYQQWDLSFRSKCAICDVLYPPEFWQQPDVMDEDEECQD